MGQSPKTMPDGKVLGESDRAYIELIAQAQKQGYQVVAVNHVGYAGSSVENPTEEKMFAGAEATIDQLVALGFKPNNLHIAGLSMGTTLAAHAAHHLSQKQEFLGDPSQHINLTMVNGLTSIRTGLEEAAPLINPFIFYVHDNMDTNSELKGLRDSFQGGRINVAFVRGANDPSTPESQLKSHREAAAGLNFRKEQIDGASHYVDPTHILRQFDEMERGEFIDKGKTLNAPAAARQDLKSSLRLA